MAYTAKDSLPPTAFSVPKRNKNKNLSFSRPGRNKNLSFFRPGRNKVGSWKKEKEEKEEKMSIC